MFRHALKCLCLASVLATGLQGREDAWIRGIFTGASPRAVVLEESEAWQQASTMAGRTAGAFVLVGSGQSMQPLYGPGTILVLRQTPFEELRRGQTVLYRNKHNKVVAHVLVAKARDGWRARGLNNRIHDMEPVCRDNLVGIVMAAYKPVTKRTTLAFATLAAPRTAGLN